MEIEKEHKDHKMLYILIGLIAGAAVTFYFLYNDNGELKSKIESRVEGLKNEVKKIAFLPEEEIMLLVDKARALLNDLESYLKERNA